jgi:hypothetical protein
MICCSNNAEKIANSQDRIGPSRRRKGNNAETRTLSVVRTLS